MRSDKPTMVPGGFYFDNHGQTARPMPIASTDPKEIRHAPDDRIAGLPHLDLPYSHRM
jgi:hypothetical protein